MLAGLAEEGVSWLDPVAFPDLNFSILNHMCHVLAEERLFQGFQGLNVALFECNKGEATAAPCHLVSHDCDIYDFSKALKVRLHIGLYS